MNIRHAATLALVGWYLMVPLNSRGDYDPYLPENQWVRMNKFDDKKSCEKTLANYSAQADKEGLISIFYQVGGRPAFDVVPKTALWFAECVNSPRAKESK